MTTTAMAALGISIQLTEKDRHTILENVLASLRKRFYAPEKLNADWKAAVEQHRPIIEGAVNPDAFEKAMSDLLAELHTSHLGFFHSTARRASSRAALSANYLADETPYGKRWIFQDVHTGGAAAIAGIEPGNILLRVDAREIVPPEHPVFPMESRPRWRLSLMITRRERFRWTWRGPRQEATVHRAYAGRGKTVGRAYRLP